MRAKAREMNKLIPEGGWLNWRSTSGPLRAAGDSWAAKFGRDWDNPEPGGRKWPSSSDPSEQDSHFYHPCAETDDPLGHKLEADHVREIQLGGDPKGPFKWLDREVNGASGRQIYDSPRTQITGFTTTNCT
jgi:hypothetical protein